MRLSVHHWSGCIFPMLASTCMSSEMVPNFCYTDMLTVRCVLVFILRVNCHVSM